MKKVYLAVRMDADKCNGDKLCVNTCPTAAIRMVDKKARIDESRCAACFRCMDSCRKGAISVIPREQPLVLKVDTSLPDPAKISEICQKAKLDVTERICVCNDITAGEVAAAILNGANTPEDVSVMTGVRTGCAMWCLAPVLRLIKAHHPELSAPEDRRWHDTEPSLWNIPDAVAEKYSMYRLKEDKELADKGMVDNLVSLLNKRKTNV